MSNQPQDESRQSLTDLGYDEAAQAKLASIMNSTGAAPSTVNLREATAEELAELTRAVEQVRHTNAAL